ncbi:MAG: hypothetical protein AAFP03_06780 [Cyanobacteria bacterium J06598_3]
MSIEQTNQLILLILNSVLMSLLSALLLGGAWLRQNNLLQQLHQVRLRYRRMAHQSSARTLAKAIEEGTAVPVAESNHAKVRAEFKHVRDRRQQLNAQYQWSRVGMLTLHGVLMIFGISLFTLALRSLFAFDLLISTALFLFTLGAGGLLAGTGCILIDLSQGNRGDESLGQSLGKVLTGLVRWWHTQKRDRVLWQRSLWKTSWKRLWRKQPALMPAKSTTSQHPRRHDR